MRQGRDLEEYVAGRFCEATGLKVRKSNSIYINEDYPFMLANIDRMVMGEKAGLECKTTNILNADKWEGGCVPAHYQIQCHHYMAVTGLESWYIAVIILGKEFKYVKIPRDEEVIKNLITIEKNFWENHVLAGRIPDPDGSKAAEEVISQYFGHARENVSIELQGFGEKLQRREEISRLLDRLEKEKKQIEQELKIAMEDAESAVCNNYRIDWKNIFSQRLDTERIKQECPDIYRRYLRDISSRRFTVKVA